MDRLPNDVIVTLLEAHFKSKNRPYSPPTLHLVSKRFYTAYLAYQHALLRHLLHAQHAVVLMDYALPISVFYRDRYPSENLMQPALFRENLEKALENFSARTAFEERLRPLSLSQLKDAYSVHRRIYYIALQHVYEDFEHDRNKPLPALLRVHLHNHFYQLYKHFIRSEEALWRARDGTDDPDIDAQAIRKLLEPDGNLQITEQGSERIHTNIDYKNDFQLSQAGKFIVRSFAMQMLYSMEDGASRRGISGPRDGARGKRWMKKRFGHTKRVGCRSIRPKDSAAKKFAYMAGLDLVYKFVKAGREGMDGRWRVWEEYDPPKKGWLKTMVENLSR